MSNSLLFLPNVGVEFNQHDTYTTAQIGNVHIPVSELYSVDKSEIVLRLSAYTVPCIPAGWNAFNLGIYVSGLCVEFPDFVMTIDEDVVTFTGNEEITANLNDAVIAKHEGISTTLRFRSWNLLACFLRDLP